MTIVKKIEPETEEKKVDWRSRKFLLILGTGLVALVFLEIWVSHTTAIFGVKFKELQDLQASLTLENQLLADQIASQSALQNIASQSATLGLKPPTDIQYIR